jgi:hypothetical protein
VGTGQARENGEIGVVVQDAKNPKRRQATISTLREISPQNHASPHLPNRRLNDTFN